MSGEEVRRLKDFSQVSSVDDKGNSDMNSPPGKYRKRSEFVGELRSSILNLGGLRGLGNVHVVV